MVSATRWELLWHRELDQGLGEEGMSIDVLMEFTEVRADRSWRERDMTDCN